jgi:hypothetical protein
MKWLKRVAVYAAPLVFVGVWACYTAPVETPCPTTLQQTNVRVAQNAKNKVDLLFMIDNSPSMAPKQTELKARFPQLIQILQTFGQTTPADYHIGVVTSDVGAGPYMINGTQCHPGGDNGQLQGNYNPGDTLAPANCRANGGPGGSTFGLTGGVNYIQYNQLVLDAMGQPTSNIPTGFTLADAFSCIASVGTGGCGFEHQLESVYRALHDKPAANNTFLRDDALLAIVFVTDEDDCSAPTDSDLFDPSTTNYGPRLSYRCTQYGIACNGALMPYGDSGGPLSSCVPATQAMGGKLFDMSRYINFFTQAAANGGVKVDPNDVILVGITAPEAPVQSILAQPQPPSPYVTCPGPPDGQNCAVTLQHSCLAPGQETKLFGDPAVRVRALINSVANQMNKQNTSICDSSYQQALEGLGDIIVSNIGPGCIGAPFDNPAKPDCTVLKVTRNTDGTITTGTLPYCGDNTPHPQGLNGDGCWRLVLHDGTDGQKACPAVFKPGDPTAQQYGVTVDWPNNTPPASTTAQVACATIATSDPSGTGDGGTVAPGCTVMGQN